MLAVRSASREKGLPHMNLTDERLRELDNPSLTENERALIRCRVAGDLTHKGQHDCAREALGELWRGIGERPNLEGLSESTAAEVLLQVGALSGWLGASRQVTGSQSAAKDLISESAALFERLGQTSRAALARSDLALRSEEHTSELQSRQYLVCRLLLEKKKTRKI